MPDFGIFRGFNEKLFGDKLYAGQLPTQLGLIGSEEVSDIDPDYKAILDYATTQGYTLPSGAQQALQNALVVDLKGAGVWSKLDTFAVFATDGDSDFALIDWINLSQYTAYNSPTFTSNQGFQGNGTSSYIDTNYNANTNGVNYSLNSASIGGYMRIGDTSPGSSEALLFATDGTNFSWMRYTSKRAYFNSSTFTGYTTTLGQSNQFASFIRTSSTNLQIFVNGSITDNLTNNSAGVPNSTFYTLRGITTNFSDSQMSMVYAGGDLSSEQSDFYTAFYTNYLSNL